jgi:hypothetical protein
MDFEIEHYVCIKFCMKLGKLLKCFRDAFGEHPLSRTVVFEWPSYFKANGVSIKMVNVQGDQAPTEHRKY